MFPTFIGILDIQSWWEVPSIAHFCSLFRAAFNLLDFDIEDLEEALLTDGGTEGRLLQELIVRLLEGCLPNDTRNDISTFNYQMFLRRLFRKKCQEYKCENPFNTDVDFELLPLRQKVEILRALCDFRLDAKDVEQSLSNLDSDSLRVEPLGHDRKNSAYWYFYGTRLYREDYIDTSDNISCGQKNKSRDKKRKKRRNRVAKEEEEEEEEENSLVYGESNTRESVWQVVCFTQQDWSRLVEKFRDSEYDTERKLYRTLSEDFMPEIPKLFDLKEKQQRRKLLQRNNSRVLRSHEPAVQMDAVMVRSKIKTKPDNKNSKKNNQNSKTTVLKEETPSPLTCPPVQKKGRQTNNSLASAVGQIVIHTRDEVEDLEKKKGMGSQADANYVASSYGYKYGYSFGIEEEERRVGMHKVLKSLKDHVDAWPFIDPVDEEYAPRYYSVVRKPMDISTMEEKLEGGSYKSLSQFKRDFRLIVDNCRQYNGSDNEYTEMAVNLKEAFDKAVNRYLESETSSDEGPSSPKPIVSSPVSLNSPAPPNVKKRSKKTEKKTKSPKSDVKIKPKDANKSEEQEKKCHSLKTSKDKKGKKKSKKSAREKYIENEEEQENEGVETEVIDTKSNRRKNTDTYSLPLKTKKLTSKEPQKMSKKIGKDRYQQKKHKEEAVQLVTEVNENKKRKEDFEEDYEPIITAKTKCRKIEKRELDDTEVLSEGTKRNRIKKAEPEEGDTVLEDDEKQVQQTKVKKNCKKEKAGVNAVAKDDEKCDVKNQTKEKEKKSKHKKEEVLKNGKLHTEDEVLNNDLEDKPDTKKIDVSKKIDSLVGDKDLESLDSLKDKISERRRKDKLKADKEKQKKSAKIEILNTCPKKVPSNGSTFHDGDKISVKRSKSKKITKEKKSIKLEDENDQDQEPSESKKAKTLPTKHIKAYGKEESSAIQALNQATEQTLHDINKWLDDAPRLSEFSSGSDSPVFPPSTECNRSGIKLEATRKRPSSIKIFGPHGPTRPKKIQRTIDRLQPGKSKGNLLLKKPINPLSTNTSDATVNSLASDSDQPSKDLEEEPKLSLGTVLKNVDSIQLICKSIVSSPNPNLSNDDDEEDHTLSLAVPSVKAPSVKEEKEVPGVGTTLSSVSLEESKDSKVAVEDTQKPKSATPNLSAWFKAFGAPKSKKKDDDTEESATKKDTDLQSTVGNRQRRVSTGGSSISGSVSSFSQESPPSRACRSPQNQPAVIPSEPPIRGAGFYQDALSTGSSPYNSPYYATPPRYSAQLPPTPSPQNHPLSPAYPSSATYEQPPLYQQQLNQSPHQTYQKSPQESSVEAYRQLSPTFAQQSPQGGFSQNSPQCEPYVQPLSTNQNQSPVYPQQSPQTMQSVYPQPPSQSSQSNYSQPSPQQPSTPKYSQPSPQSNNTPNYSQPSPQAASGFTPQPSPQQHSPYSQPSPQPPPNYSQQSPQSQHSPYAQSSPQPSPYAQLSPQPPSNYSQPSPQQPPVYPQQSQPPSFSQPSPQTHSAPYSQPSPQPPASYSQPSPQPPASYSQPSPQPPASYSQPSPQPPASYSQPSPQPPASYSQPSPQPPASYSQPSPQPPASYSQPSPQPPAAYSQPSPQPPGSYSQPSPQSRNYSQPSPQQQPQTFSQHSPQPSSTYHSQPSPQSIPYSSQPSPRPPPSYSQPSPQQPSNYSHPMHSPQTPPNYSQLSPQQPASTANYPQLSPQQSHNYPQLSPQSNPACPPPQTVQPQGSYSQPSPQQTSNFAQPQLPKQTNQPTPYLQCSRTSGINEAERRPEYLKPTNEKPTNPEQQQRSFVAQSESSLNLNSNHHIYQSAGQYQSTFLGKTVNANEQLQVQDQSQLLTFQQNLPPHESLYQPTFQAAGYTMPNTRPMYPSPHYFDGTTKSANTSSASASVGNLPPVKKRMYNESSTDASRNSAQDPASRSGQDQFGFDPMIGLPQPSETVSTSQYDGAFVTSLADSVATNPAYARLGLGLVGRTTKEQQQLLTIPRPPPAKAEHLAYARSPITGSAELDLNLLQSLQNTTSKGAQSILSMSRRGGDTTGSSAPTTSRAKKSKKAKQQQQQQQQQQQEQQNTTVPTPSQSVVNPEQQGNTGIPGYPQYPVTAADGIGLKNTSVVPPSGSAFNFAAPTSSATTTPFYDKDASAAAAAFAFLDEFRNPNSYYSMALRQQQQQQQHQQPAPATDAAQVVCNKLNNQAPRNYAPHPFLHSTQRSAAYGPPPVSAYVTPHGPNLAVDPAAYQQYIHSLYALQPPPHHHRPSWL